MAEADQWVGVAPCVRAGIRSLLRRFEDQQAALDEAARGQAMLLNAHARSEARCEALEAQIVAARQEAEMARTIANKSSTHVAELAAELAKRPTRDEVEARASEAFAAATKDSHAAIALAEDRAARRSDEDARKLVALVTSRDRATREETRQAIDKAVKSTRTASAATSAQLEKSLHGKIKAEGVSRSEDKQRLGNRCDALSREADSLHKAYELLRDEVRQNVREGCEFAVASANDALDEARTELSRLANNGAPADATSVGAGLAKNVAALVASISEEQVERAASVLRSEAADASLRHAEAAADEKARRDDETSALGEAVQAVERRCATAIETATRTSEAAAHKMTKHAVQRCATEAKAAADDTREATERVVLAAVSDARRAAELSATALSREIRAVDARGAAAAAAAVDGCRIVAGESAAHAVEACVKIKVQAPHAIDAALSL